MFSDEYDDKAEALDAIRKHLHGGKVKKLAAPHHAVEVTVTKVGKEDAKVGKEDAKDGDKGEEEHESPDEMASEAADGDDEDTHGGMVAEVLKHLGRYLPSKKE